MVYKENIGEILCHIQLCSMPDMGVVDNASNENNENTRRKAVSYTHLDVYKRQRQSSMEKGR